MTAIAIFGLATITMAQVPSYVPTNGLVGWWPFNGNANDESGNGNNGTNIGATLTTDRNGISNSAFYFSGASCSTRIDATINTSSITAGFTLSFWSLKSGAGCESPRLIEFWPGNNIAGYLGVAQDPGANPVIIKQITSSSTIGYLNFNYEADNVWAHYVYTNDGANVKMYQNGLLIITTPSIGNISLASNASFGRMNHPANDAHEGKLDDIGLWNRALTQQEIADLYASSSIGISEDSQSNLFSVFPNPSQSLIYVKTDNKLIGEVYTIYDNTGRVVLTGKINSHNTTIELGNLSVGIYIFSVGENMKQAFKIIKE